MSTPRPPLASRPSAQAERGGGVAPGAAPSSLASAGSARSGRGKQPPRENLRLELAHQRAVAAVSRCEEQEEDLREELAQLQAMAAAVRDDEQQVRAKVRRAERDSHEKDKLLQELLMKAKSGEGVSDEALDRLRDDLQYRLHCKARNFLAMQKLYTQQEQISEKLHEVRGNNIHQLEEEVLAAKAETKRLAKAWLQGKGGPEFPQLQHRRREAEDLVAQIQAVQAEASGSFRKLEERLEEARAKERECESIEETRRSLEIKRSDVSSRIGELDDLDELHTERDKLQGDVDAQHSRLQAVEEELAGIKAKLSVAPKYTCVHSSLLEDGFVPLPRSDPMSERLLWRLRQALALTGRSVIQALSEQDTDSDGFIVASELTAAMRHLGLPSRSPDEADHLLAALDPAVAPDGLLSVLDFALAMSLQPRPDGPSPGEAAEVGAAIMWASRRAGISEREVLAKLSECIDAVELDERALAKELVRRLGLEERLVEPLAAGLEMGREEFLASLPRWQCREASERSALRGRFVAALAATLADQRSLAAAARLKKALDDVAMPLEDFLRHMSDWLESHPSWCEEDLEEVALADESAVQGAAVGRPPVVDSAALLSDAKKATAEASAAPPPLDIGGMRSSSMGSAAPTSHSEVPQLTPEALANLNGGGSMVLGGPMMGGPLGGRPLGGGPLSGGPLGGPLGGGPLGGGPLGGPVMGGGLSLQLTPTAPSAPSAPGAPPSSAAAEPSQAAPPPSAAAAGAAPQSVAAPPPSPPAESGDDSGEGSDSEDKDFDEDFEEEEEEEVDDDPQESSEESGEGEN